MNILETLPEGYELLRDANGYQVYSCAPGSCAGNDDGDGNMAIATVNHGAWCEVDVSGYDWKDADDFTSAAIAEVQLEARL